MARKEVTSRPQLKVHERMIVISLSEHGWTIRQIAEFIERSEGCVQGILKKWRESTISSKTGFHRDPQAKSQMRIKSS